MVNNSTNIDQSRLISMNSLNTKKTVIYDIGNAGPGLDRQKHVAGLNTNQLIGSQPSYLDNCIPNSNAYINIR
jgi:hypothetical protein